MDSPTEPVRPVAEPHAVEETSPLDTDEVTQPHTDIALAVRSPPTVTLVDSPLVTPNTPAFLPTTHAPDSDPPALATFESSMMAASSNADTSEASARGKEADGSAQPNTVTRAAQEEDVVPNGQEPEAVDNDDGSLDTENEHSSPDTATAVTAPPTAAITTSPPPDRHEKATAPQPASEHSVVQPAPAVQDSVTSRSDHEHGGSRHGSRSASSVHFSHVPEDDPPFAAAELSVSAASLDSSVAVPPEPPLPPHALVFYRKAGTCLRAIIATAQKGGLGKKCPAVGDEAQALLERIDAATVPGTAPLCTAIGRRGSLALRPMDVDAGSDFDTCDGDDIATSTPARTPKAPASSTPRAPNSSNADTSADDAKSATPAARAQATHGNDPVNAGSGMPCPLVFSGSEKVKVRLILRDCARFVATTIYAPAVATSVGATELASLRSTGRALAYAAAAAAVASFGAWRTSTVQALQLPPWTVSTSTATGGLDATPGPSPTGATSPTPGRAGAFPLNDKAAATPTGHGHHGHHHQHATPVCRASIHAAMANVPVTDSEFTENVTGQPVVVDPHFCPRVHDDQMMQEAETAAHFAFDDTLVAFQVAFEDVALAFCSPYRGVAPGSAHTGISGASDDTAIVAPWLRLALEAVRLCGQYTVAATVAEMRRVCQAQLISMVGLAVPEHIPHSPDSDGPLSINHHDGSKSMDHEPTAKLDEVARRQKHRATAWVQWAAAADQAEQHWSRVLDLTVFPLTFFVQCASDPSPTAQALTALPAKMKAEAKNALFQLIAAVQRHTPTIVAQDAGVGVWAGPEEATTMRDAVIAEEAAKILHFVAPEPDHNGPTDEITKEKSEKSADQKKDEEEAEKKAQQLESARMQSLSVGAMAWARNVVVTTSALTDAKPRVLATQSNGLLVVDPSALQAPTPTALPLLHRLLLGLARGVGPQEAGQLLCVRLLADALAVLCQDDPRAARWLFQDPRFRKDVFNAIVVCVVSTHESVIGAGLRALLYCVKAAPMEVRQEAGAVYCGCILRLLDSDNTATGARVLIVKHIISVIRASAAVPPPPGAPAVVAESPAPHHQHARRNSTGADAGSRTPTKAAAVNASSNVAGSSAAHVSFLSTGSGANQAPLGGPLRPARYLLLDLFSTLDLDPQLHHTNFIQHCSTSLARLVRCAAEELSASALAVAFLGPNAAHAEVEQLTAEIADPTNLLADTQPFAVGDKSKAKMSAAAKLADADSELSATATLAHAALRALVSLTETVAAAAQQELVALQSTNKPSTSTTNGPSSSVDLVAGSQKSTPNGGVNGSGGKGNVGPRWVVVGSDRPLNPTVAQLKAEKIRTQRAVDVINVTPEKGVCRLFDVNKKYDVRPQPQAPPAAGVPESSANEEDAGTDTERKADNSTAAEQDRSKPRLYAESDAEFAAVAQKIAGFLCFTPSLSPLSVGEYLSGPEPLPAAVAKEFMRHLSLRGLSVSKAIGALLTAVQLPKEGQRIERLLEAFASAYFESNVGLRLPHLFPFQDEDACFVLTVATVMLNTDLHNPRISSKMNKQSFCAQLRDYRFPPGFSEGIFDSIASTPLSTAKGIGAASVDGTHQTTQQPQVQSRMDYFFFSREERQELQFGVERRRILLETSELVQRRSAPCRHRAAVSFASNAAPTCKSCNTATVQADDDDEEHVVHREESSTDSAASCTGSTLCGHAVDPTPAIMSAHDVAATVIAHNSTGTLDNNNGEGLAFISYASVARELFTSLWGSLFAVFSVTLQEMQAAPPCHALCVKGLQDILYTAAAFNCGTECEATLSATLRLGNGHSARASAIDAVLFVAGSPFSSRLTRASWAAIAEILCDIHRLGGADRTSVPATLEEAAGNIYRAVNAHSSNSVDHDVLSELAASLAQRAAVVTALEQLAVFERSLDSDASVLEGSEWPDRSERVEQLSTQLSVIEARATATPPTAAASAPAVPVVVHGRELNTVAWDIVGAALSAARAVQRGDVPSLSAYVSVAVSVLRSVAAAERESVLAATASAAAAAATMDAGADEDSVDTLASAVENTDDDGADGTGAVTAHASLVAEATALKHALRRKLARADQSLAVDTRPFSMQWDAVKDTVVGLLKTHGESQEAAAIILEIAAEAVRLACHVNAAHSDSKSQLATTSRRGRSTNTNPTIANGGVSNPFLLLTMCYHSTHVAAPVAASGRQDAHHAGGAPTTAGWPAKVATVRSISRLVDFLASSDAAASATTAAAATNSKAGAVIGEPIAPAAAAVAQAAAASATREVFGYGRLVALLSPIVAAACSADTGRDSVGTELRSQATLALKRATSVLAVTAAREFGPGSEEHTDAVSLSLAAAFACAFGGGDSATQASSLALMPAFTTPIIEAATSSTTASSDENAAAEALRELVWSSLIEGFSVALRMESAELRTRAVDGLQWLAATASTAAFRDAVAVIRSRAVAAATTRHLHRTHQSRSMSQSSSHADPTHCCDDTEATATATATTEASTIPSATEAAATSMTTAAPAPSLLLPGDVSATPSAVHLRRIIAVCGTTLSDMLLGTMANVGLHSAAPATTAASPAPAAGTAAAEAAQQSAVPSDDIAARYFATFQLGPPRHAGPVTPKGYGRCRPTQFINSPTVAHLLVVMTTDVFGPAAVEDTPQNARQRAMAAQAASNAAVRNDSFPRRASDTGIATPPPMPWAMTVAVAQSVVEHCGGAVLGAPQVPAVSRGQLAKALTKAIERTFLAFNADLARSQTSAPFGGKTSEGAANTGESQTPLVGQEALFAPTVDSAGPQRDLQWQFALSAVAAALQRANLPPQMLTSFITAVPAAISSSSAVAASGDSSSDATSPPPVPLSAASPPPARHVPDTFAQTLVAVRAKVSEITRAAGSPSAFVSSVPSPPPETGLRQELSHGTIGGSANDAARATVAASPSAPFIDEGTIAERYQTFSGVVGILLPFVAVVVATYGHAKADRTSTTSTAAPTSNSAAPMNEKKGENAKGDGAATASSSGSYHLRSATAHCIPASAAPQLLALAHTALRGVDVCIALQDSCGQLLLSGAFQTAKQRPLYHSPATVLQWGLAASIRLLFAAATCAPPSSSASAAPCSASLQRDDNRNMRAARGALCPLFDEALRQMATRVLRYFVVVHRRRTAHSNHSFTDAQITGQAHRGSVPVGESSGRSLASSVSTPRGAGTMSGDAVVSQSPGSVASRPLHPYRNALAEAVVELGQQCSAIANAASADVTAKEVGTASSSPPPAAAAWAALRAPEVFQAFAGVLTAEEVTPRAVAAVGHYLTAFHSLELSPQ